jgi:hypothetical protein
MGDLLQYSLCRQFLSHRERHFERERNKLAAKELIQDNLDIVEAVEYTIAGQRPF